MPQFEVHVAREVTETGWLVVEAATAEEADALVASQEVNQAIVWDAVADPHMTSVMVLSVSLSPLSK
jgi:hypothetical protein